uniref:Uncharacterized protein n=1 Tax=Cantharellus cibarius TaxID=36066 RepID=A0A2S0S465_CANCI|nr:hypothetical protein [Cantharellus cibarius]AWA82171.1 hypothetical protein [Cantharellus cibarius]
MRWSCHDQVIMDRTGECCNILRWIVVSRWKTNHTSIAGFPRKIFKYHIILKFLDLGGYSTLNFRRKSNWGALKSYLWKLTSEYPKLMNDSQTIHDKVGSQNVNRREHVFKVPQNRLSEIKEVFPWIQLLS